MWGPGFTILELDYRPTMTRACELRLHRAAESRAEALEQAFDAIVRKGTKGEWVRVGEVCVNKPQGKVSALCSKLDDTEILAKV